MSAIRSGTLPSMVSWSCVASAGLAAAHASLVAIHTSYLALLSALTLPKYSYVSGDTYHFDSGRPSDSRAESAYLTPASPWAAQVPAISSIPLPMMVLQTMSVGLPLSDSLAYVYALVTASMSWPSTVSTSQPCDSKRCATSSDCVCSAILSRVTPLESYMRIRLSSFSWPAKAAASLAMPSCRQPSPQSTTTWWSMIVCSSVLSLAAASLAAAAMPTPLPTPWPSGPVVDSTPTVQPNSGWPGVFESLTRKFCTSSIERS